MSESCRQLWLELGIDPLFAESVVWPEHARYNPVRDRLETSAVRPAYILTGKSLDFSLGAFQMKPSFVEKLEAAWAGSGLAQAQALTFDLSSSPAARSARLDRMESPDWQAVYLGMFILMLYSSYGSFDQSGARVREGLDALPIEEQLRLAATAYNRGCSWPPAGSGSLDSLRAGSTIKSFPRAIIRTANTRQYSYAALCLEHYKAAGGAL